MTGGGGGLNFHILGYGMCHFFRVVTLKSLFALENLPLETFWVEFPIKKYKQLPAHIGFN